MTKKVKIFLSIIVVIISINCSCKSSPEVEGISKSNSIKLMDVEEDIDIWQLIEDRVESFKNNSKQSIKRKDIPSDFLMFYNEFLLDSTNQKNKINFIDFIGVMGECDTTIRLNSNNWVYSDWNFIEFFEVDLNSEEKWNNTIYYTNMKFYYEFKLEEVGIIYQVGFEKINDRWMLTLYYVNNC